MKFYEDLAVQCRKHGERVCGDVYVCDKGITGAVFIVCDGIGSGPYANIAAISCASRLRELVAQGVVPRRAADMVAASMHKAREQEIPFSAFSLAHILPDGRFAIYVYESPEPVLIVGGLAQVLDPVFHPAGYEVLGEASGQLATGDSLLLFSDGVSQAGLGHGYAWGLGAKGAADFINKEFAAGNPVISLPRSLAEMCAAISGGRFEDDTTCLLIYCRQPSELSLLTGPPSRSSMDAEYVRDFLREPGLKVVCGSTTAEIVARELAQEVRVHQAGVSFGSPPEYEIDGIDLVTEGAVLLNQAHNILGESPESLDNGVVGRFCKLLAKADAVHIFQGNASNTAHSSLLFKQIGILPRKNAVQLIADKLKDMGKVVSMKNY